MPTMRNAFKNYLRNFDKRAFVVIFAFILLAVVVPDTWSPVGAHSAHAGTVWDWIMDKTVGVIGDVADATFGRLFKWLANFIDWAAGLFMIICSWFLDYALEKTLDSALITGLKSVNIGWTLVRDLSNMFFIFILLYIAIETVLGLMGHQTKQLLRNIIIVALLINFSLPITKIIIDASNILALAFYWKVETTVQSGGVSQTVNGPTAAIMEGLKIQTTATIDQNPNSAASTDNGNSQTRLAFVFLGGAIIKLITGYVFIFGGILFVIRSIVFLFCMIFSPFAFLGMVLPRMRGITSKWWNALLDNALVAPVFTFMIYLDATVIRNNDLQAWTGSNNALFAQGLSGNVANFSIFYNFAIMIGLMIATIYVSKSVASSTASYATSWAKKGLGVTGGAAAGGLAYTMRNSIGRFSANAKQNDKLQKMAAETGVRGMLGRTLVKTANVGARSSYDVRGGVTGKALKQTGVNFGAAGGAGGRVAYIRAKDDDIRKKAEELFPNNPQAQENYIRNATRRSPTSIAEGKELVKKGIFGGQPSRYDDKPGKYAEKADKVLSEKNAELQKEKLIEQTKVEAKAIADAIKTQGISAMISPDNAKTFGAVAGTTLGEALKQSFDKLSGKDGVEMLSKEQLNDPTVHSMMNKQQVAYMLANAEKYQANLKPMTASVMANGREETRSYLIKQAQLGNANVNIDMKKELANQLNAYDRAAALPIPSGDSPEAQNARQARIDAMQRADSAAQDILGGMKPKDVARLDDGKAAGAEMDIPRASRYFNKKHRSEVKRYYKDVLQKPPPSLQTPEALRGKEEAWKKAAEKKKKIEDEIEEIRSKNPGDVRILDKGNELKKATDEESRTAAAFKKASKEQGADDEDEDEDSDNT